MKADRRTVSRLRSVSLLVGLALVLGMLALAPVTAAAAPVTWTRANTDGFGAVPPGKSGSAMCMAEYNGHLYAGTVNYEDASGCDVWRYDGSTTWTNVATGGFGDANNYIAWSMAVFNGLLYVSTGNGVTGADVYAYDGAAWTQVNANGFGAGAAMQTANVLCVFDGALYAAANNPLRIYRYDGGTSWTQVNVDGFGTGVSWCRALAVHEGSLYAGTGVNGRVYRYDGGTAWTQVNTDKFGSGDDPDVRVLQSYNGVLYAGTARTDNPKVWRYSGSGTDWTDVTPDYPDSNNDAVRSMTVFNGLLFVGVGNYSGEDPPSGVGTQVYAYDGQNWDQVNDNGFDGDGFNQACHSLAGFNGYLYAGVFAVNWDSDTYFGARIWRAGLPNLSVVKSAPSTASPGYPLKYTVSITNSGTADAKDVIFIDPVPDHTTIVDGSVTSSDAAAQIVSDDPVVVTGITVEAGRTVTITFQVTVDAGTPLGTTISNQGVTIWDAFGYFSSDPAHQGQPGPTTVRVVSPDFKWYLAEGSYGWGFATDINIENPNPTEVTARVTFMTAEHTAGAGVSLVQDVKMPPESRTTLNLDAELGPQDFSTKVECLEGLSIAADRTMYWASGTGAGMGSHNSIGVTASADTWYLPEGSSAWGFECWTCVQNANTSDAHVKLTYMVEGVGPASFDKVVPAQSRSTFSMKDDIGEADASIKVESDRPVIPERSMYLRWTPQGAGEAVRREGHCSIGTTTPANDYYLAEGSTDWGFTTYVLVQNPNTVDAVVTLTYMTPEGPVSDPPFTLIAQSRKTVRVNDLHPDMDFSTMVSADRPIIAERAMYWDTEPDSGTGMHDSIGTRAAHRVWYLPEGETTADGGIETYTCVQNPGGTDVEITVTYFYPWATGLTPVFFTDTVPANSRRTYSMADKLSETTASIMVECDTPGSAIIAERSVYYGYRTAGTNTIGGWED
ncbi:MAG: hypothetical protein V1748_09890 [Actinomycetota bacterium]